MLDKRQQDILGDVVNFQDKVNQNMADNLQPFSQAQLSAKQDIDDQL